MFSYKFGFFAKLLFFIFVSILIPFIILSFFLSTEIKAAVYKEKQDKLFGLAMQLDHYLEGTFEDILIQKRALSLDREQQIDVLNRELRDITDFVASGNPGVGVGYYAKELDAVITYGPSEEFDYTVGVSIDPGHEGLIVMETGEDRVQTGELVRGNIMNCMHPIIRAGNVIGYIWSNETVDMVQAQFGHIMKRVIFLVLAIFVIIYFSVFIVSKIFLNGIDILKSEIEKIMDEPNHRIPQVAGELNIIGAEVNRLLNSIDSEKSHNKYILDAVVSSVIVLSNDGVITHANPAFYRLFNHLDEKVYGMQSRKIFGEAVGRIIDRGLFNNDYCDSEELNLFDKIVKVSSNAVIDGQGNRLGLILIFQDITLIRRYETELNEKERAAALGEMSLSVAHELKNPLTSVKGFTQMLQEPAVSDEKRMKYLGIMEDELNRVNLLLNDLLLYGGPSPVQKQDEDLVDIIQCLFREYRMVKPDIEFVLDFETSGNFVVPLDKNKMIQVFENLIKNSIDAMEKVDKGKLLVRLERSDEQVFIAFRDNGCGINENNFSRIYNPFFTTKTGGCGFGLPICYRIIEKHGGSIHVSSIEGEYTEVSIVLNGKETA